MRIAYEYAGTGPPVALVSGLGQPGERWRRVVSHLTDDFTVVTFDNRETGRTGAYPAGFDLGDLAIDILDTMTAIGFEDFHLAGLSMGGMISQEVLNLAPDRLRSVALIATHGAHAASIQADPEYARQIFSVPPADPEERLDAMRGLWSLLTGPGFAEAHPEVIEEEAMLSISNPTRADGFARQMQAITRFDPGEVRSAAPVAVIHGDSDRLIPTENGRTLAERFGVDLTLVAGGGHDLDVDSAAPLANILKRHMRDAD